MTTIVVVVVSRAHFDPLLGGSFFACCTHSVARWGYKGVGGVYFYSALTQESRSQKLEIEAGLSYVYDAGISPTAY